jgi:aryl-alcohol dehydrogenase-like predicted oxidoreductase
MSSRSRRDFLKTVAAGVLTGAGGLAIAAKTPKRLATDWVTLGNSGVKVTRLALGTGTMGGRVQRELGQEPFTKIVRHAYDSGIRFFETAEAYTGMPEMLATALKGIPRDSYKLMTKFRWLNGIGDPQKRIDGYRSQLNSDYFDIMLIHCVRTPDWAEELKPLREALDEAKQKKIILAHGASTHGLDGINSFPGNKWLDVALCRINHKGVRMDTPSRKDTNDIGDVQQVTARVRALGSQGTGLIGMKLVGEGQFTSPEDRDAAIRYAFDVGKVDAVTIGYKNTAEIDEAVARINRELNA